MSFPRKKVKNGKRVIRMWIVETGLRVKVMKTIVGGISGDFYIHNKSARPSGDLA